MIDTAAPHPFRIPDFRYFWASRLLAMLAQNALMLILGWQAYNLARDDMGISASAGILGLIGLLQFVPLFLLTPLVGWVADRLDRRRIAAVVVAGQALLAGTLAWLTFTGAISLWAIFGVAVVLGIFRAFMGPALNALAPNLVPPASIPRAIALSTIAWQVGVIAGPAMAGPLYVVAEPLPYAICTLCFAVSALALLRIGPVRRSSMDRSRGPLAQVADGIAYVWTNKLVLGAITLDLLVMFLAGAQAMLPVFARDILQVGAPGLSMLAAAPAIGAVLMAGLFSIRPMTRDVGARMLLSMALFGLGTIGFGLSQALWLSVAALALCGAADMVGVYVRSSLIQLNTPDAMRGRVGAVSQLMISASNELGDALTGALAAIFGPIAAVVAGGIGAIVVTGVWSRLFPDLASARTFTMPAHVLEDETATHSAKGDAT